LAKLPDLHQVIGYVIDRGQVFSIRRKRQLIYPAAVTTKALKELWSQMIPVCLWTGAFPDIQQLANFHLPDPGFDRIG
jgi:hypothetical protein